MCVAEKTKRKRRTVRTTTVMAGAHYGTVSVAAVEL